MSILNDIQLLQNLYATITGVATARGAREVEWEASTDYVTGRTVKPTTANNFFYQAGGNGTSGSSEPTWPTSLGGTVVDNDITWTAIADTDHFGLPSAKLDSNDFPLALTEEGEGKWRRVAGMTRRDRLYNTSVFLDKYNQKRHAEAQGLASLYLNRFGNALTDPDNRSLATLTWILSELEDGLQDSGFGTLEYLGDKFYGFVISVPIRNGI